MSEPDSYSTNVDKQGEMILNSIKQLQEIEMKLFESLETCSSNNNCKDEDLIMKEINTIGNQRKDLFKIIIDLYENMSDRVKQSRQDLVNQLQVAGVMEEQLNNTKKNINLLKSDNHNKLRMVEINTYYSKNFKASIKLMKLIIVVCVILLILAILGKKDYIGVNIVRGASSLVLLIGTIMILASIYDIYRRDNMVFDEYDFSSVDVEKMIEDNKNSEGNQVKSGINMGGKNVTFKNSVEKVNDLMNGDFLNSCSGEECCDKGTKWNKTLSKCEPLSGAMNIEPEASTDKVEGFEPANY